MNPADCIQCSDHAANWVFRNNCKTLIYAVFIVQKSLKKNYQETEGAQAEVSLRILFMFSIITEHKHI